MKRHLNSVTDQLNWATRQKYNYDPNCLPSHWLPEVPIYTNRAIHCEALSYLCDSFIYTTFIQSALFTDQCALMRYTR